MAADSNEQGVHSGPCEPIARFPNAAEAGYFAHELTGASGIPAELHVDQSFDAVSGCWEARYVLLVPQELATAATAELNGLIARTTAPDGRDADLAPKDDSRFDEHNGQSVEHSAFGARADSPVTTESSSSSGERGNREYVFSLGDDEEIQCGVNWGPIVLTLAAGSAVLFGVRALDAPKAEAPPTAKANSAELWELLHESPEPWVQRSPDGTAYREFRIDADGQSGVLRDVVEGRLMRERRVRRDNLHRTD